MEVGGIREKWRSCQDHFPQVDALHCYNIIMGVLLYTCRQNLLHCCFLAIRDEDREPVLFWDQRPAARFLGIIRCLLNDSAYRSEGVGEGRRDVPPRCINICWYSSLLRCSNVVCLIVYSMDWHCWYQKGLTSMYFFNAEGNNVLQTMLASGSTILSQQPFLHIWIMHMQYEACLFFYLSNLMVAVLLCVFCCMCCCFFFLVKFSFGLPKDRDKWYKFKHRNLAYYMRILIQWKKNHC